MLPLNGKSTSLKSHSKQTNDVSTTVTSIPHLRIRHPVRCYLCPRCLWGSHTCILGSEVENVQVTITNCSFGRRADVRYRYDRTAFALVETRYLAPWCRYTDEDLLLLRHGHVRLDAVWSDGVASESGWE